MRDGHTLMESVPGTDVLLVTSAGSTPTRWQNVAYQSATDMYPVWDVPCSRAGRYPPLMKLTARTPPSKSVTFPPLSG